MSYSFLFKYIVIGNPSVGKSCILLQFMEKIFKIQSDPTIGVQFASKTIKIKNKSIKLQIWDTAGQEAYQSITRSYYRGTIGVFLVYDISSRKSFIDVQKWLEETKTYSTNQKIVIMLVGNKEDLTNMRAVSIQQGKTLADKNGLLFMECSAKTGYNVDLLFDQLSLSILEKIENGQINPGDGSGGIKIGINETILTPVRRSWC